jgi:hypothetical protein
MDQVTQQNAALVEQTAAASHTMGDQARELQNLMAFFKLDEATATQDNTVEPWRKNLRHELDAELTGPRPAWWWTGRPPRDCPGRQPDGALTSLPLPNLATCTRQQALGLFRQYLDIDRAAVLPA